MALWNCLRNCSQERETVERSSSKLGGQCPHVAALANDRKEAFRACT